MKKIFPLLIAGVMTSLTLSAQDVLSVEDMNSVYKKEKHHNKIVQKYAPLRQADVMWSRKIWREIDLRQKNKPRFLLP